MKPNTVLPVSMNLTPPPGVVRPLGQSGILPINPLAVSSMGNPSNGSFSPQASQLNRTSAATPAIGKTPGIILPIQGVNRASPSPVAPPSTQPTDIERTGSVSTGIKLGNIATIQSTGTTSKPFQPDSVGQTKPGSPVNPFNKIPTPIFPVLTGRESHIPAPVANRGNIQDTILAKESPDRSSALSELLYKYGKSVVDRLASLRLTNGNYLVENVTFVDNFSDMVNKIGLEPAIDVMVNGSRTVGHGQVNIEGKINFPDVRTPYDGYGQRHKYASRIFSTSTDRKDETRIFSTSTPLVDGKSEINQFRWESSNDPFLLNNQAYLNQVQRGYIETTEPGRIKTRVKGGALCPNCQSDNTTFELKQLRSADEPVTPIYTCKNCGRIWNR